MSMIKAIVESVNEHNDWQEEKIAKLEELIREYRSRILLHTNEETLFAIDQDVADWKFRTEPSGLCNTGGRVGEINYAIAIHCQPVLVRCCHMDRNPLRWYPILHRYGFCRPNDNRNRGGIR